jgi:drug/metabolite transporter (DMT)-like permease
MNRWGSDEKSERSSKTLFLTLLALTAFAANSVLCRLALEGGAIDASSFTGVRLVSGAATLWVISLLQNQRQLPGTSGSWTSATLLFLYAVCFSFAYMSLSIGTGALILFGAVQATMITAAFWSGERPSMLQIAGVFIAIAGLVYLVLPGVTAPSPMGSALMSIAGVSWGFYSLKGRGQVAPLSSTTGNFARSVPLAIGSAFLLYFLSDIRFSWVGFFLAVASGALASGLGYVVWYSALRKLTAVEAAAVQLSVPILAAIAGLVFLSESISFRLVLSAVLILGGVGIALSGWFAIKRKE